ncbi:hypothetical protein BCR35DRAFT_298586 [Leucosporidium creatinivorum]|uniref:Uncharacterized protein n=1 Tax=Leucosporidium creatinivorum TaxID=106004 RepID=A0A1Y2G7B9_9BASI|nr:hypothetical protein BCR35DRAFT_298586 [Leucosporidium creatinivorum]
MGLFKRSSIIKTPATQAPEPLLGDDEGFEETKPIIYDGETTNNTPAKRPPEVVAKAWQEYGATKRQFAEDEKNEGKQLTRLEKGLKELEKAEAKAHKAVDKAQNDVHKANKQVEKHSGDSGKQDELAKAEEALQAKRSEQQTAEDQVKTSAEQLDRAKADKEVHDRDRASELDASMPRDKYKQTIPRYGYMPGGPGGASLGLCAGGC